MFLKKFPIFLSFSAGLIDLAIGLFLRAEPQGVLLRLIITFVVFYILGACIRAYLLARVFPPQKEEPYIFLTDEEIAEAEARALLAESEEGDADGNREEGEFAEDAEYLDDFDDEGMDMDLDDEEFAQALRTMRAGDE
ncbi:MAG: hypothetical protein FWB71_05545 [Defluviitaleaceae bacterium]|nr:hypothetical protein [Defluviitaleaceae bacterium]